jgi:hypothetical protein
MRTDYLVYTHTRPDTNEIFYVGKGSAKRVNERRGRSSYWNNIVNKANGFISNVVAGNLDNQTALNFEKILIKKLREDNFKLCNITDGGECGATGYKHSSEMKEYIRAKAFGNKSRTGQKSTVEHKQKISQGLMGRVHTEATKNKMGKMVYCVTNGKTYTTQTNAAKELNLLTSGISMCCKKAIKQTGGYQFKYI